MALPPVMLVVFLVSVLTSLAVAGRLTAITPRGRIPESGRQWSASATPRIGGVAVFASLAIALVAAAMIKIAGLGPATGLPHLAGAMVISGTILFAIGLLDDIRGVRPILKLIGQTAAALVVCAAGFSIEHVTLIPGYSFHLGIFALPLTVVWLVGVSNAFNLIDGMDGLAGGVAIIALLTVGAAGLFLGNPSVPIYAVGLVGALLGFLRYNWPSARLFMGDSGSLVVGFLLAVLSVKAATSPGSLTFGLVPIFALAYPLLDTAVAMLRRWLRGVPLSRADRRHIHHQLRALGIGPTKSLIVIYTASALVGGLGLLVAFAPPEVTLLTSILGVTALLLIAAVSIYRLEYHEFFEAGASLASALRKAKWVIRDKINARDIVPIIRRAETLEEMQAILEDSASLFRFAHMKLHTAETRRRPGRITQELQALRLWKLEYPILEADADDAGSLSLTIWCGLDASQRPAGAERVARIIGPAIIEWAQSGKYTPAPAASYGDRLLHAPYTPHGETPSDRALLETIIWRPSEAEEALRCQALESGHFRPLSGTAADVNAVV